MASGGLRAGACRPYRAADFRGDLSAGDQFVQFDTDLGSIGLLRTVYARGDDQLAFPGNALAGYREKAPAYRKDAAGKMVAMADKDVRDEKAVMRCVAMEKGEAGKPDSCTPMADLMHYNEAYPGHQIAMIAPLSDGRVKYSDGTPATIANYAADVSAFLSWTADPTLEERKRMGWQVLLYLLITSVLLFIAKKRIWANAH